MARFSSEKDSYKDFKNQKCKATIRGPEQVTQLVFLVFHVSLNLVWIELSILIHAVRNELQRLDPVLIPRNVVHWFVDGYECNRHHDNVDKSLGQETYEGNCGGEFHFAWTLVLLIVVDDQA